MLRAGVVAVLAVGSLLSVPVTPALADDPDVQITSLPNATLGPGERVDLKFRVTNKNLPVGQQTNDSFNITVSMPFAELTCQGQCNLTDTINRGESKDYAATLIAGTLGTNQTKSGTVQIDAKSGGDHGNTSRQVTVRGPEQAPTVKEINGKVTDSATGAGLRDVLVGIQDSQNHTYLTTTNRDGRFSFVSSSTKPIVPGEILITAQKDNFKVTPKRLNANAGQTVSTTLAMISTKPPEPTATAEATQSALPSDEPSDTALATDGESLNAAAADTGGSGGGGLSWVLIVLGGLLVAIGVGAIVLLLVRRKEDDGDEEGDFTVQPRGPVPTPASRGMYHPAADPTRVASRAGAGPTMVARPPMADAPTMLHQPAPDPYADPYGAPPRGAQSPVPPMTPPGTYGAARPGWADAGQPTSAQPPYGTPGGYGSPSAQDGSYGAPAGGYGTAAGGYGAPAGGYGSPSAPAGSYGAPAGGYGGHGSPAAPAGGYGSPAAPAGGYGSPAARPADEGYAGRDYSAPTNPGYGGGRDYAAPTSQEYGASGSGYSGGGYAESGGPYDAGPEYGRPAQPYESGGYQPPTGGGYPPPTDPTGRYDQSGYGQSDGGYDQGGYDPGGYDQGGGGYDARSGYDRVPEQRGGYESRGYDADGYRDEAGGAHSRHAAEPQPTRAERRSLDWLDD
ncbi:MAG TPA: hypothetical protein VGJ63_01905 [Micromonosporaceae bacterium]